MPIFHERALFSEFEGPNYIKFGEDIGPSSALPMHVYNLDTGILLLFETMATQMRLVPKINAK